MRRRRCSRRRSMRRAGCWRRSWGCRWRRWCWAAGVRGGGVRGVNGPASVVVSGDAGAVERVAEGFAGRGVRVRRLRVSHAFHSHRMDPVLEELGEAAAGLDYGVPRVPWAGALSGELVTEPG